MSKDKKSNSRTVLYARVSNTEQTPEHQVSQARAAGFDIDEVVEDHGVSGVNTLMKDRPGGSRLFDMLRAEDVLVVRWVDRLGRNYRDVTETIREFMDKGVVIKTMIHGMTFDGSAKDPMTKAVRDALIGFMAASAEAQAETIREAQQAGIEHAKEAGRFRGRKPSFTRDQFELVVDLLGKGEGISSIARETGLSRQTVYRIKDDKAGAEAMLRRWV
ncbi:MAG: recombinase family protein [Cyanobacteria bacterium P01_A01_bin.17]